MEIVSNSLPPIESSPNPNPMPLVDVEPEKEKTQQTVPKLRVYSRRQHHQQDTGQAPRTSIAPRLEPSLNPAPNLNNKSKDQPEIDRIDLSLNPTPNPNRSSSYQPENNESETQPKSPNPRAGSTNSSKKRSPHIMLYLKPIEGSCPPKLPKSTEEAMKFSDLTEVVFEEMIALKKNGTWEICSLPKGVVPVGCKWVFTVKQKSNGAVERFKADLVGKGYTQTYGIDYLKTFAPMTKK